MNHEQLAQVEEYNYMVRLIEKALLSKTAVNESSYNHGLQVLNSYGIDCVPAVIKDFLSNMTYTKDSLDAKTIRLAQRLLLELNTKFKIDTTDTHWRKEINDFGKVVIKSSGCNEEKEVQTLSGYEALESKLLTKVKDNLAISPKSMNLIRYIRNRDLVSTAEGWFPILDDILTLSDVDLTETKLFCDELLNYFKGVFVGNSSHQVESEEATQSSYQTRSEEITQAEPEVESKDYLKLLTECKDIAQLSKTYSTLRVEVMKLQEDVREDKLMALNEARNEALNQIRSSNSNIELVVEAKFHAMSNKEYELYAALVYDKQDNPQDNLIILDTKNQVAFL